MPHATIIGAGIAGTATAVALTRTGWRTTVHERALHPETGGAALGIWPAALAALDELGVGHAVRAAATAQVTGSIRRPDGAVLATLGAERVTRHRGDQVQLIARRDLAGILAGALPDGDVRYGSPVEATAFTRGARGTGAAGRTDLLVVADGVFSTHRTALLGQRYRARYTGQSALRGRVHLTTAETTETWGPGRRFGVTPYRDGTTNWYASLDAPPGERAPGGEVAVLRDRFAGWHQPIDQILEALTDDDVLRHDLYDVHPHLPTYAPTTGDVDAVLVGDAAHGMTPDLGRGACEALVDAVTLARCLAPAGTVDQTARPALRPMLAGYDRQRRRPTQRLQSLARTLGQVAHARRLTGPRDLLMSVLG